MTGGIFVIKRNKLTSDSHIPDTQRRQICYPRRPGTSRALTQTSNDVTRLAPTCNDVPLSTSDVQRRRAPLPPTSSDVAPHSHRRPATSGPRSTDVQLYKTPCSSAIHLFAFSFVLEQRSDDIFVRYGAGDGVRDGGPSRSAAATSTPSSSAEQRPAARSSVGDDRVRGDNLQQVGYRTTTPRRRTTTPRRRTTFHFHNFPFLFDFVSRF